MFTINASMWEYDYYECNVNETKTMLLKKFMESKIGK